MDNQEMMNSQEMMDNQEMMNNQEMDRWVHRLIDQHQPFALYRLPWSDDCCLVWQPTGEVETLHDITALGACDGFVMAPFSLSASHPAVLIRPEVTARGEAEVTVVLRRYFQQEDLLTAATTEYRATTDSTATTEYRAAASAASAGSAASAASATAFREYSTGNHNTDEHSTGNHNRGDYNTTDSLNTSQQLIGWEAYQAAFGRFMEPLQKGTFSKLVLSRKSSQAISADCSWWSAFQRACKRYPRMMVYLCHTPVTGTWMGSTPEILLSGEGHAWHTVALAGTMPISGEVLPQEWSPKNREEQAFVAAYIRGVLQRYGIDLTEEGPYTTRAGQLAHLKTDFHFWLSDLQRLGSLLKELHPTPAVCGLPKQQAWDFILREEGYDRRYYSGFVGRLNPAGRTDIYVNLRCMEMEADKVQLYAGGGILPQSAVQSEWTETEEKMKTMRCLFTEDKLEDKLENKQLERSERLII